MFQENKYNNYDLNHWSQIVSGLEDFNCAEREFIMATINYSPQDMHLDFVSY